MKRTQRADSAFVGSTATVAVSAFAALLAVLLMHSVPMVHAPAHGVAGAHAAVTTHQEHAGHTTMAPPAMAADSTHWTTHAAMALCMALITVASVLLIVRRLLGRQGANAAPRIHVPGNGRYASRAPPWAAPSLEKLSILRI